MDRFLNFLGLLKRSNQIVSGSFLIEKELKKNRIKLILFANNISDNSKKNIDFYASKNHVECLVIDYSKEELGYCIGTKESVCIGVKSQNCIIKIKDLLKKE